VSFVAAGPGFNAKQSRVLLFPCNLSVRLTVPEIRSAMKITLYYATGKEVISNQGKARTHKALRDCGFGVVARRLSDRRLGSWEPGMAGSWGKLPDATSRETTDPTLFSRGDNSRKQLRSQRLPPSLSFCLYKHFLFDLILRYSHKSLRTEYTH
jgi:hypothetical protein